MKPFYNASNGEVDDMINQIAVANNAQANPNPSDSTRARTTRRGQSDATNWRDRPRRVTRPPRLYYVYRNKRRV